VSLAVLTGGTAAFGLIILGLYRTLRRIGGVDFLDRLALLSLLAVLPQATLWLTFKLAYPFFDVRLLLMRLLPLYLAATIAAVLPSRFSEAGFSGVRWTEILASSAAAGLLIIAISLSAHALSAKFSGSHGRALQTLSSIPKSSQLEPVRVLPEPHIRC